MKYKINIACLPVAGIENPYQHLMIQGLNESDNLNAFNGIDDRFFGIYKTVKKFQPDYLHFDWIQSYYERRRFWMTLMMLPTFMLQVIYIKYFTKTQIVWTLHNILPHNVKHIKFHKWMRHWFGKQCKWIRVFSGDSIQKATLELKLNINKFIVVPEGDYKNVYPNEISENKAREILNLPPDSFVFLSLGYIKQYKGIEKLIEYFSNVPNQKVELLIAGQGIDKEYVLRLKDKLKALENPNIRLRDTFISTDELQTYYNAADIVVLPFDKVENSGSAIMAMGFKKSILAPKMGVLKKRLSQQENLLYDDLQEGLKNAMELNKEQLQYFGQLNFDTLEKYQWKDFGNSFMNRN
jgi:glycosyltransferase involved in cell wall biosynthesis